MKTLSIDQQELLVKIVGSRRGIRSAVGIYKNLRTLYAAGFIMLRGDRWRPTIAGVEVGCWLKLAKAKL